MSAEAHRFHVVMECEEVRSKLPQKFKPDDAGLARVAFLPGARLPLDIDFASTSRFLLLDRSYLCLLGSVIVV